MHLDTLITAHYRKYVYVCVCNRVFFPPMYFFHWENALGYFFSWNKYSSTFFPNPNPKTNNSCWWIVYSRKFSITRKFTPGKNYRLHVYVCMYVCVCVRALAEEPCPHKGAQLKNKMSPWQHNVNTQYKHHTMPWSLLYPRKVDHVFVVSHTALCLITIVWSVEINQVSNSGLLYWQYPVYTPRKGCDDQLRLHCAALKKYQNTQDESGKLSKIVIF